MHVFSLKQPLLSFIPSDGAHPSQAPSASVLAEQSPSMRALGLGRGQGQPEERLKGWLEGTEASSEEVVRGDSVPEAADVI